MRQYCRQPGRVAKSPGIAVACFLAWFLFATTSAAETSKQHGFAEVLATAGIDSASMAPLANWRGEWQAAQTSIAQQILYRLSQLDHKERTRLALPEKTRAWLAQPGKFQGALVLMRGRVVEVQELKRPSNREPSLDSLRYRCVVELAASTSSGEGRSNAEKHESVLALTPQVPAQWLKRPKGGPLDEPVQLAGVVLGETEVKTAAAVLALTDHIAWYPDGGVPADWVLLAKLGYDVGLLDEVRHRRPFVKPAVSGEGEAFQALLKAVRGTTAAELDRQAKQAVERRLPKWQKQADKRRDMGIALAAVERGKSGLSSVAPMFLTPQEETGRLERLEGTARRAVRIVPEEAPGAAPYYELEVFTNDSQNLPVVCCAASLPEGFPTGDAIRAPVRAAGFFFKSWVYRSREASPVEAAARQGNRPAVNRAPVVVVASVEWIRATTNSPAAGWGLWGGIAVLALAGSIWWALAKAGRNDRLARQRNRRYDSSL